MSGWAAGCRGDIPDIFFQIRYVEREVIIVINEPYAKALRANASIGGWYANNPRLEGSFRNITKKL